MANVRKAQAVEEKKMPDLRLCITCNTLVNLNDPHVMVLQQIKGGRRTTVRDSVSGLVHVVTSKKETEKMLAAQNAVEEK